MRLKNIPGSREYVADSNFVIPEENTEYGRCTTDWSVKGHWHEIFGNDRPVRMEIGMGKGSFIMEQARRTPDINFVGIEKYSSVLIKAIRKQEAENLPNLKFIRMDAENINYVFAQGEAERIYLNFSDPWPKKRNTDRRLTSERFLRRYEQILLPGDLIEFKTDNTDLFDFSLESAANAGWEILSCTRDLHADPVLCAGNIMTEYEAKFSANGQKICKMVMRRPVSTRLYQNCTTF